MCEQKSRISADTASVIGGCARSLRRLRQFADRSGLPWTVKASPEPFRLSVCFSPCPVARRRFLAFERGLWGLLQLSRAPHGLRQAARPQIELLWAARFLVLPHISLSADAGTGCGCAVGKGRFMRAGNHDISKEGGPRCGRPP